jgi:hypothetical protein
MHWTVTGNDRDEHGAIRVDPPTDAPPPTPKLSNRRGVADAPSEAPATPRADRRAIAGAIGGLVVAVFLIAFIGQARSGMPIAPPPPPTAAPARPTAAAPALVPTIAPSATPAPATATPEPPTQTPAIVYVEQPTCYSVTQDVYDGSRPLGTVTGTSCESQAAARANADALAAQMKGGK